MMEEQDDDDDKDDDEVVGIDAVVCDGKIRVEVIIIIVIVPYFNIINKATRKSKLRRKLSEKPLTFAAHVPHL
jgi:hypothetical protein